MNLIEIKTPTELDAAQRVIESDSFLMFTYLQTPGRTFREKIKDVYKSQIRHDAKKLAEFNRIKKELEAQNEQTGHR